jgi:hypothetical protein
VSLDVRGAIETRLKQDLIGPYKEDEILTNRPSDQYTLGLLWPKVSKYEPIDADNFAEESDTNSDVNLVGQSKPASMGISFSCKSSDPVARVTATFKFALYEPVEEGEKPLSWARKFYSMTREFEIGQTNVSTRFDTPAIGGLQLQWHLRTWVTDDWFAATVTVINNTNLELDENNAAQRLNKVESVIVFQSELSLEAHEPSIFTNRHSQSDLNDQDALSSDLLYREIPDLGTGHQCATESFQLRDGRTGLRSTWMPIAQVPGFSEKGDPIFEEYVSSDGLSALKLGEGTRDEICNSLTGLVNGYKAWIDAERVQLEFVELRLKDTGERHLAACTEAAERMLKGIRLLQSNDIALDAFRFANRAMALQHSWKAKDEHDTAKLTWRPFQIAFVLLSLESTLIASSEDREILDLLWFPTGGGKTEAYLCLIACAAWFRLLQNPSQPLGVVALMRYTLRLLTAQQFERASALILACEYLRRNARLGTASSFSIGLWVGGDATPNTVQEIFNAASKKTTSSPKQLFECFACGSELTWTVLESPVIVSPTCPSDSCALGENFGLWPVLTVDELMYERPPTLVIATIDKFAQIATKRETSNLFNFRKATAPDLIIQDELHLISGPLGTIAGLYETALDYLLSKEGHRPKIIGSTATIKRAQEQALALFNRKAKQFPPPGLSYENSAFAVVDRSGPSRHYVGIPTVGRSAKFALQSVAASALQSSTSVSDDRHSINGYSTAVLYFNALKDLGGAVVLMQDDVADTMNSISIARGEQTRKLDRLAELTSRISQSEIIEILQSLNYSLPDQRHVDAVLATNMVSVGVDVSRLGLMIVQGLPKSRAEYIQATSRVGRKKEWPGLVLTVMNSTRNRDRSSFENFNNWHGALYRDVEPTSVTPFAPRAREKALHAVLVAMLRHTVEGLGAKPDFDRLMTEMSGLRSVLDEIETRVANVDEAEFDSTRRQVDDLLDDWQSRWASQEGSLSYYLPKKPRSSLMQTAESFAKAIAQGKNPFRAWPTMNNMRSVEAASPFKLVEILRDFERMPNTSNESQNSRPWRRT